VAGIGFELKRVLQRGGIARFLTVSLTGTAIVAGPWLLSVLGIFLIQRFAAALISEAATLFMAVVVYSYAFSLMAASGLHYVFTRWISDLIYEEKTAEAGSALLAFLLLVAVGATVMGCAGVIPLSLSGVVAHPRLFSVSAVALFVIINVNWVLMSYVSLLKAYLGIFLVYLGGSLASFLGVVIFGLSFGTAGGLMGYALGQLLTAASLYAMTLRRYAPTHLPFAGILAYLRRYRFLFLSGTLYAWATWIDKVVFWFAFGARVTGGWLAVFDRYDIPVFFAILTLIPALIFFTVETETSFYPRLREFLKSLNGGTYQKIQEKKYAMIRVMNSGLRGQILLQGICTAVALLLAPVIGQEVFGGGVNIPILRLTLAAVFFHSLFLSLIIFLFYFELYARAFASTLAFFAVNLIASLCIAFAGSGDLAGVSYLAGGIGGCIVAGALLARSASRMDKLIFAKSARG
jgi:uncharacterized membrane protein